MTKDISKEMKTIVNNSFITFMYEVEEAIIDGWKLSTTDAPAFNFVIYEAFVEREVMPANPVVKEQKIEHSEATKASLMSDLAATLDAPKKAGRPAKDKA